MPQAGRGRTSGILLEVVEQGVGAGRQGRYACGQRLVMEDQELETQADAVAYFTSRGYAASRRTWIVGDSVCLPFGQQRVVTIEDQAITVWSGALYLYPRDGAWILYGGSEAYEVQYATLERAVRAAEEQLVQHQIPRGPETL